MKPLSLPRPRTICLATLVGFSMAGLLSPALHAQSQNNTSVAEAARKAKEQKKTASKESLVITEETLTLRPASADTGEAPPAGTVINTTPVMPAAETPTAPADTAAPTPPAEPAKSTDASAPTPAKDTASTPPAEPVKPADSSTPTPAVDTTAPAPADANAKKAEEQAAEIAKTKEMLAQAGLELDLFKRQLALDSESYYSQPDYAHDRAGKTKIDDQQRQIEDKQASLQELKDRLAKLMQEAGVSANAEQAPAPPAQ